MNFAMGGCIIAAIFFSTWLGKNKFTDSTVAEKMAPKIESAEFDMKTAKADLVNYVTENKDAVLDDSNSEYHKKRVAHLHSVSAVNQLRATKTHDETKGLHIFGVTVPFSNLVRDVLLILIALVSLKLTPMYKMVKDDHGHEVPAEGEEESAP